MILTSLVVVLVAHVFAVSAVEAESDPPVTIDIDSPLSLAASLEPMKAKAWGVEIPNVASGLKPGQNPTDLRNVVRAQSSGISRFVESLQSSVLEPRDHRRSVTRNGSLVNPWGARTEDGEVPVVQVCMRRIWYSQLSVARLLSKLHL